MGVDKQDSGRGRSREKKCRIDTRRQRVQVADGLSPTRDGAHRGGTCARISTCVSMPSASFDTAARAAIRRREETRDACLLPSGPSWSSILAGTFLDPQRLATGKLTTAHITRHQLEDPERDVPTRIRSALLLSAMVMWAEPARVSENVSDALLANSNGLAVCQLFNVLASIRIHDDQLPAIRVWAGLTPNKMPAF